MGNLSKTEILMNTETQDRKQPKEVVVTVNGHDVRLPDREVTGAEIKAAAIAQGVAIQLNFILQRELPNGREQIVGDADRIKIRPHDRFTAIAPDDNS
jgi:hypothetical protein